MNCPDVRPLLPALAYDDLPPAEVAAVRNHLDACPGCRDEFAGLAHARAALDAIPVPTVKVDFARVYTEVAARQERRARRWRRVSMAAVALAATVLVAVGLRLQVRVGANELVIAWGEQPNREGDRMEVRPSVTYASGAHVEERLKLLDDLTHALAADNDRRDRRYQQEMADLGRRLQTLQRVAMEQWRETERNLSALYVAQFKPSQERNTP
jgi:anti-sigma factor RsiW